MKKLSVALVLSLLLCPNLASAADCIKADRLLKEAMTQQDTGKAMSTLKQAIGLCPQSAVLRYNLAMLLVKEKRYSDARTNLSDAIKINLDFAEAYNALAYINVTTETGDIEAALGQAVKAVDLDPENPQYRDTLSLVKNTRTLAIDVDIPLSTKQARPDAVAVVVGNKNYRNANIPTVDYAINDAEMVRKYLVDTLGYKKENIIYMENADKTDLQKVFGDESEHKGDLYSRVKADVSDVFIYYSGHGAPEPVTKKAYLVPSNTDPNSVRLTAYPLDRLYENLLLIDAEKRFKSLTIVMDACFSGVYNDGTIVSGASPLYLEIQKPILKIKNAVEFSSSRGDQVSSWYREKMHGVFTYYFLKAIKEAARDGRTLTAEDIETALNLKEDNVNDTAWNLYKRKQEPSVIGAKGVRYLDEK